MHETKLFSPGILRVMPGLTSALLLAGCAGWPSAASHDNTEINRGVQNNQKSSPDSGQSPAGDGLGGRGGQGR